MVSGAIMNLTDVVDSILGTVQGRRQHYIFKIFKPEPGEAGAHSECSYEGVCPKGL